MTAGQQALSSGLLLVDPDPVLRSALRIVLDAEADLRIVGDAAGVDEALVLVAEHRPELAVIGPHLSHADTISFSAQVTSRDDLPTRILVLVDGRTSSNLLLVFEAGAIGCLLADSGVDALMHNIRAALRGEACVPRQLLGGLLHQLIDRRRHVDETAKRIGRLSRREREVLTALARGHDLPQIATTLVLSPQTVRTHIQNILRKLEVHSRIEAATLAVECGMREA